MNEKKKLQPKVRFREFTGENAPDWEQRKLGEIAKDSIGGGTPKTEVVDYWDGNLPWIQSSDLLEHKLDTVEIKKKISYKGLENSAAKLVPANSIAIVTRVGVGKLAIIPFDYSTSQDILSLCYLKINKFFAAYLIYRVIQRQLKFIQGTSIKGITKSELLNFNLLLPESLSEQECIGNLLKKIDKLITLHQRKLEQLEQLKNTLLSKMFPKSGTNIPEIRFSGFTDAWKQRKLKEMLEERNELILESKDYPLMSFVQGKGVIPKSNRYDRSFLVKNDKKKYKKTELNDFIYSSNNLETGSIGFNKTGNAVISPVYSIFKSKNKLESRFIGIISRRKDFIAKMLKFRQGVVYGQWKIDEDDFLNISVFTPNIETQKYIIDLFIIIDNYIAIHQRKLEQLKNLKQTLLNKMFI